MKLSFETSMSKIISIISIYNLRSSFLFLHITLTSKSFAIQKLYEKKKENIKNIAELFNWSHRVKRKILIAGWKCNGGYVTD